MPTFFQKPENALQRAREFLEVDKKESALDILAEVMKSKRHRQWNRVHEEIMTLFLELCVELRKNQVFKEVIHQYKNMTLNVNPGSLIDIVRKYLEQADLKTEEAKGKSKAAVTTDQEEVDDLDVIETPESLMMSAVSGETTQDRSDRAILVPWLKFMWESYRQCLDLLRNNNKMEHLYHEVARMAFRFCEKYGRKTEFRKLNDILRNHLGKLATSTQVPPSGVNLNNPETQGHHLETRLAQLEYSMNLELYNEAYKSIEDIWNLVTMSKKSPKPSIMSNYYNKVALVFWKCNSHLFHAAALHKLFHLHREHKKNMAAEELQAMASTVLCATLAIPLPYVRDRNADSLLESGEISSAVKQKLLCNLLGMSIPPSRRSLCQDLARSGIVELALPELANMYASLEERFQPLRLAPLTAKGLEMIRSNPRLSQYSQPIEDIVICRTLIQLSQVYTSILLDRFGGLFPFCDSMRLETTIVEAARNLEIPVRVDHRRSCLFFGGFSQLGISQREEGVLTEGPSVKTADQLSRQLVFLGGALQGVLAIIQPDKEAKVQQRRGNENEIDNAGWPITFEENMRLWMQSLEEWKQRQVASEVLLTEMANSRQCIRIACAGNQTQKSTQSKKHTKRQRQRQKRRQAAAVDAESRQQQQRAAIVDTESKKQKRQQAAAVVGESRQQQQQAAVVYVESKKQKCQQATTLETDSKEQKHQQAAKVDAESRQQQAAAVDTESKKQKRQQAATIKTDSKEQKHQQAATVDAESRQQQQQQAAAVDAESRQQRRQAAAVDSESKKKKRQQASTVYVESREQQEQTATLDAKSKKQKRQQSATVETDSKEHKLQQAAVVDTDSKKQKRQQAATLKTDSKEQKHQQAAKVHAESKKQKHQQAATVDTESTKQKHQQAATVDAESRQQQQQAATVDAEFRQQQQQAAAVDAEFRQQQAAAVDIESKKQKCQQAAAVDTVSRLHPQQQRLQQQHHQPEAGQAQKPKADQERQKCKSSHLEKMQAKLADQKASLDKRIAKYEKRAENLASAEACISSRAARLNNQLPPPSYTRHSLHKAFAFYDKERAELRWLRVSIDQQADSYMAQEVKVAEEVARLAKAASEEPTKRQKKKKKQQQQELHTA